MALAPRRITSAEEMRALAHPVRLQLLELLAAEGAFTASEAGRRLGETPANISWHLRLLARHGFVRQGEGPGRKRPWKLVALGLTFGEDAEDRTLATTLGDLVYDREFDVLRTSLRQLPNESRQWQDASAVFESRLWLTPDEASEIAGLFQAFIDERLLDRNQDPSKRPAGSRLMALMGWVVPAGPPAQIVKAAGDPGVEHQEETA